VFVFARSGPVLVLAPLLAVLTLAGCGPKKTTAPAPSTAAATAPGRGSSSAVQGSVGAAKTCTGGHTQATINGRPKCLAAQTCSSKAISQYPQYGYVCLTSNGRLILRRK